MTLYKAQERPFASSPAHSSRQTHAPKHVLPTKRPRSLISPKAATNSTPAPNTSSFADTLRRFLKLPGQQTAAQKVDERYRVFLDEWDKGFMDAKECPEGYFADVVYGEIPKELEGTLFRNGPGKFTLGGKRIPHPYDGDGLIASLAIKNGKAFFRSKFVKTPEFLAEAAAEDVLFRGTFATQRAGGSLANAGDLYVKNTSNTNVIAFGDRLWSFFEASQPYRLDPWTLSTKGPELLDGLFQPGLPFDLGSKSNNAAIAGLTKLAQGAPSAAALPEEFLAAGGDAVTAHPHICPKTGRLVTFSYRVRPVVPSSPGQLPLVTDLTFYELEESTMKPALTTRYTLPGFAFLHDFAMTENYYILFQNPVTVDNAPYVLGAAPAASCVRWVPNTPTKLHIIPRKGTGSDKDAMVFSAPPLFVFHHANAYEESNGQALVIDSIHYDSLPAVGREALSQQAVDPDAAFTSRLRRVEIDLKTNVLKVKCAFDGYLEMPAVNPAQISRKHKYVYGYHSIFEDPQIALAKVDVEGRLVETWKPGKNRFALEPRMIPRGSAAGAAGEEDDGWLIAQLFDSEALTSEIVILDAKDLSKGPVAVVRLQEPLPSALHSCWTDKYYGPQGEESGGGRIQEERTNVLPFGEAGRLKGTGEKRKSMPSAGGKNSN